MDNDFDDIASLQGYLQILAVENGNDSYTNSISSNYGSNYGNNSDKRDSNSGKKNPRKSSKQDILSWWFECLFNDINGSPAKEIHKNVTNKMHKENKQT